jgi:outer membrane protein assembly factor BamA
MRWFFFLCFLPSLLAQDMFLERFRSNDSLLTAKFAVFQDEQISETDIETVIHTRLEHAHTTGFWFAKIDLSNYATFVRSDSTFLTFAAVYTANQKVHVDSLIFNGIDLSQPNLLERESRLRRGQLLKPSDAENSRRFLERSNFVEYVKSYQLLQLDSNRFALEYSLKELSTSFINAIVGFTPAQNNQKAEFTSDVHLEFANIAGTGRNTRFLWQKKSPRSSYFTLDYTEPWLFSLPIQETVGIEQFFQDSIYTKWRFKSESVYALNPNMDLELHFAYATLSPVDSAIAYQNRLPITESYETGLKLTFNSLNRRYNPQNGFKASIALFQQENTRKRPEKLIEQYNLRKSYSSTEIEANLSYYMQLQSNHVLALSSKNRYKESSQLSENDYFYFGGHASLRGFREQQFKTVQLMQQGVEYRLLLSDYSRIYAFFDHAWYKHNINEKLHAISGTGFGFRFNTAVGIIGVDYAFESDNFFNNGLLHIGLFGTID